MKGKHLLRIAIATVLDALFAAAPGAAANSAETEPGVSTVTVEMRLWQDVNDAENVWMSARPEGGSWRALGTIPFPLDADDGTVTYRYRDLAIAGAEFRVWQEQDEPERFYLQACGSACPEEAPCEARGMTPLPLDDGHSPSGRYRYGDLTVAVPLAGPDLLSDWENLLAVRDTLAGTGTLDWDVGTPMSRWEGVAIAGSPARVSGLRLADASLSGELSGLLGELTGLTELRLEGNMLTGWVPSKLTQLADLTELYLGGNQFEGCVPTSMRAVTNTDLGLLDLPDCGPPLDIWDSSDRILSGATYRDDPVVFDVPSAIQLEIDGYVSSEPRTDVGPATICC